MCLVVGLLCSCASTKFPSSHTAYEQWSALHSEHDRALAAGFYEMGQGDEIKKLYWAQRDLQRNPRFSDAPPPVSLQRRYVNVPVPEHVDPDGTIKEPSNIVVETVQLWAKAGGL